MTSHPSVKNFSIENRSERPEAYGSLKYFFEAELLGIKHSRRSRRQVGQNCDLRPFCLGKVGVLKKTPELWSTTNQKPIDEEIRIRRWKWLGHTMRKDPSSITRQSLRWNPAGKRSRGRPKKTWRRTVEDEMKQAKLSWGEITNIAQNRVRWRNTVAAVCASAGAMRN